MQMGEYPEFSHQLHIHAAPAYVGKGCSRHIYLLVANELAGKHPQTSRKSVTELAFLWFLKETVLFSHGFERRHGENGWERKDMGQADIFREISRMCCTHP